MQVYATVDVAARRFLMFQRLYAEAVSLMLCGAIQQPPTARMAIRLLRVMFSLGPGDDILISYASKLVFEPPDVLVSWAFIFCLFGEVKSSFYGGDRLRLMGQCPQVRGLRQATPFSRRIPLTVLFKTIKHLPSGQSNFPEGIKRHLQRYYGGVLGTLLCSIVD